MRRLVKCDAANLFVFHKILFFCAADVPGKNTAKLLIIFFQLFIINKIFENTLSLRVAGNGTKKPVTIDIAPAF